MSRFVTGRKRLGRRPIRSAESQETGSSFRAYARSEGERLNLLRYCYLFFSICLYGAPPPRIVSTSPSITETLFALGLGPQVVGVTTYCNYPAQARQLPKIGTYLKPNLESIAALRPTLVIVERSPQPIATRLGELHLNVVEVRTTSVADIFDEIVTIGKAASVPDRAQALIDQLQSRLEAIRLANVSAAHPRALFLVGREAGRIGSLFAVGRNAYLDDVMRLAGLTNIYADSAAAFPKVSLEELLARNPEVVFDWSQEPPERVRALWAERFPQLDAVRHGRIVVLTSDAFLVPGPRLADAASELARLARQVNPHEVGK